MDELVRVKEGSKFAGVCTGLEAKGSGNRDLWRWIFALGSFFFFFPFFIYMGFAIALPQVESVSQLKAKKKQKKKIVYGGEGSSVQGSFQETDAIESELNRLKGMLSKGLIEEDEYQQLRKRMLGL
jgi:phage shock protein PspC (stress-responsive transcriptional regulator)